MSSGRPLRRRAVHRGSIAGGGSPLPCVEVMNTTKGTSISSNCKSACLVSSADALILRIGNSMSAPQHGGSQNTYHIKSVHAHQDTPTPSPPHLASQPLCHILRVARLGGVQDQQMVDVFVCQHIAMVERVRRRCSSRRAHVVCCIC